MQSKTINFRDLPPDERKELIERLRDYVVNDPYTTELCREAASALRSQATYEQMLSDKGTEDALTELDRARANARARLERSGA